MRKFLIHSVLLLTTWVVLAQCFILKNRLSDATARSLFDANNVSVRIHDTLIEGRHVHYAVSGADTLPTLVFIHGSPGSWTNYRAYMWDSGLLRKFRMASIDRPGFGYSDFGKPLRLADQCRLIAPVIRRLANGKRMYLCGHSMGAPVAVQLAAMTPELVSHLVLVGAPLDPALEKPETWRRIMDHKPLYWALPGAFGPSNTELLYLKEDLVPFQEELSKVTAHVYFIHGDRDDWVPIGNVAHGLEMMTRAARIRSDTLFGAGHLVPWKNTDAFRLLLMNMD